MTRSVADAIVVHEVLAARTVTRSHAPLSLYRLAVVRNLMQDDLDPTVARTFSATLARLRAAGATIVDIDLPALDDLPALMAHGGFAGAESYALHRAAIARAGDRFDPRVGGRASSAARP